MKKSLKWAKKIEVRREAQGQAERGTSEAWHKPTEALQSHPHTPISKCTSITTPFPCQPSSNTPSFTLFYPHFLVPFTQSCKQVSLSQQLNHASHYFLSKRFNIHNHSVSWHKNYIPIPCPAVPSDVPLTAPLAVTFTLSQT